MPNWSVGTLKVRGEKENISKFLKEALTPIGHSISMIMGGIAPTLKVEEDEDSLNISAVGTSQGFHLKGTRRNFIDSDRITWYFDDSILLLESFQAAWGLDVEGLSKLSKEYQIDMKIYAFESGMQFNEDFEVHKGEIIKYQEVKFADYDWECIYPTLGG
ncbi:hypothetical protein G9G63_10170 [Paenibacillus sp. EKM202P]|uniref:hypothetical protein n=1 Tax=unclassified Paenibacillus TaxID=185978 RepID=UPI0013EC610C|nr:MULTISPECIES: hypothetical protein [unclassified Paenibacillus]KAF6564500.1 hypothetical protein G9G63_10170 [Paenibacillus sp. EKM202P]KAF6571685.1 hypothetical protein G9G64_06605 [Paenibacillus sp. EKM207P]